MSSKKDDWFADRLQRHRRAARVTQARLAELLGVSEDTVKGWERSSKFPAFGRILELSKVLKVEPAAFFPTREELNKPVDRVSDAGRVIDPAERLRRVEESLVDALQEIRELRELAK